jgi:deoxyribodipyrimidine photo-lyase
MRTAVHWFRADLRLGDNTALHAACAEADAVIPVFIFDPAILRAPDTGAPITGFMLETLRALERDVAAAHGRLVFRHGRVLDEMKAMFRDSKATALFYNRDYEPFARERDAAVEKWARGAGIEVRSFKNGVLHEPHEVLKDDGKPYGVFTAYARKWRLRPQAPVLPAARFPQRAQPKWPRSVGLPTLKELGFKLAIKLPPAGEKAARAQLQRFVRGPLRRYATVRNFPAEAGTSQLSPHLRLGSISPRTVLASASRAARAQAKVASDAGTFVGELIWRDFYRQILWHFPHAATGAFKPAYRHLKWSNNERLFAAWCEGRTGFPIVDAGMRQLNATGWMHNRVRMIVASFLCKDLLVSWQRGERYFMQRLLDADLASNNGGWQWSASTGTDAQPYFRIFNPLAQARKFDPEGGYIRRWIPEIDSREYPRPIVEHAAQRLKALALYRGGATRT